MTQSNLLVKKNTHGFVVLNKPSGLSSSTCTHKIKRLCGAKTAGHLGTLDPFATGVLVIALDEATKIIPLFESCNKEYEFDLCFGKKTDTGDLTGQVIVESEIIPDIASIKKALPHFLGLIEQTPPKFSAIHIDGKRAYDLARQGIDFEIPKRRVFVHELSFIERIDDQTVRLKVLCGTGTYVRTLGEDIAAFLGTVGYLKSLIRVKNGSFSIKDAISLNSDCNAVPNQVMSPIIYPIASVLDDILAVELDEKEAQEIRFGRPLFDRWMCKDSEPIFAYTFKNDEKVPQGLMEKRDEKLWPKRLFNID